MCGLEAAYETRLAVTTSLHSRVLVVVLVEIYTGRAARLPKHVQVSSVYIPALRNCIKGSHTGTVFSVFYQLEPKAVRLVRIHHLRALNRVYSENENILN